MKNLIMIFSLLLVPSIKSAENSYNITFPQASNILGSTATGLDAGLRVQSREDFSRVLRNLALNMTVSSGVAWASGTPMHMQQRDMLFTLISVGGGALIGILLRHVPKKRTRARYLYSTISHNS